MRRESQQPSRTMIAAIALIIMGVMLTTIGTQGSPSDKDRLQQDIQKLQEEIDRLEWHRKQVEATIEEKRFESRMISLENVRRQELLSKQEK